MKSDELPLILSLCDRTGNAVKPWAKFGFECWIVDIQHKKGISKKENNIIKVGEDVRYFCPPLHKKIGFIFAFPPCTHLAATGAKWWKIKGLQLLSDGIALVAACNRICETSDAPFLIENPVGSLSNYWRPPNYSFDPYEYAGYLKKESLRNNEAYTKKTCLWTGNNFYMPPKKIVHPFLGSKMHRLPPSPDRADIRSVTPKGFSKAVFIHNHKQVIKDFQK